MGWLKILGWILGIVVMLLAAVVAAVWLGGGEMVAWALRHPVSTALGRQIKVERVTIEWGSPTRIVADRLQAQNAGWGTRPEMFAAKRVELDIYPWSVLFGPTRISLLQIDQSEILLETAKDGSPNWRFGANAAAPKKRGQFPNL